MIRPTDGVVTIRTDDLVGIREMAELLIKRGMYGSDELDKARSQVTTWIARRNDALNATGRVVRTGNDFPESLVQLKATGVYDRSEVVAWIDANYSRTGKKL